MPNARVPVLARDEASLWDALAELIGDVDSDRTHALVPTMGALHDGHRELIRRARSLAPCTVVSVYVNPLQFGPGEDFDRYPRTLAADLDVCAAEGVDVVFAPDTLYPPDGPWVTVSAGELGGRFEGAARPGHFDGVLTVVLKLLHIVEPDVAVFGEKDFQQLALIRRMVVDLHLDVEIDAVPVVRDPDGLARSSRNAYLSDSEREVALALSRALRAGAGQGEAGADAVLAAARAVLAGEPALAVDYLELLDERMSPLAGTGTGPARLLVAARVGRTRLIDNMAVRLGARTSREDRASCSARC